MEMLSQYPHYNKRIALILCNPHQLPSVAHDAQMLPPMLIKLGFKVHIIFSNPFNIRVNGVESLTFCNSKSEMLNAIDRVLRDVDAETSLYLHISSHGSTTMAKTEKVKTENGVQTEGSEYIPFCWRDGCERIYDSELNALLLQRLPACQVLAAIDTCHSATMLNLFSSIHYLGSSIRVQHNLDSPSLKAEVFCLSPTIDQKVTIEAARGGLLTNQICRHLGSTTSITDLFVRCARDTARTGQTMVLSTNRRMKLGTHSL